MPELRKPHITATLYSAACSPTRLDDRARHSQCFLGVRRAAAPISLPVSPKKSDLVADGMPGLPREDQQVFNMIR